MKANSLRPVEMVNAAPGSKLYSISCFICKDVAALVNIGQKDTAFHGPARSLARFKSCFLSIFAACATLTVQPADAIINYMKKSKSAD
ncbi:MAG: hypothetical protein ACOX8S_05360 [Christensenellales bacterium]|jgi:hypothetical protein